MPDKNMGGNRGNHAGCGHKRMEPNSPLSEWHFVLKIRNLSIIALLIFGCLAACTKTSPLLPEARHAPAVAKSAEVPAASNEIGSPNPPETSQKASLTQIIPGTGRVIAPQKPAIRSIVTPEGDVTLNFVNADVREVVKNVLGDMLKLDFVIDPAVQGAITLSTSQSIKREAVIPALENALRLNGIAIARAGGVYRVLPVGSAAKAGGPQIVGGQGALSAGYSVRIVPLHYVSAADMQRALEPLVPQGSILRADPARNLIVVAGTEQELTSILENIATFDVDYMAGMSFGLFQIKNAGAKAVAGELSKIFANEGNPVAGMVRFVPIERLNAILVTSVQPAYLDKVRDWIDRLDQGGDSDQQRIYVYYVQNGRAADLAASLTKILGGAPSGGSSPSGTVSPEPANYNAMGSAGFGNEGNAVPAVSSEQENPIAAAASPTASASTITPRASGQEAPANSTNERTGAPKLRIAADEINNALMILATPQEYHLIEDTLRKLDITPLQVLIEASVAEVTLTNDLKHGVQYFIKTHPNTVSQIENASGTLGASFPGFNYIYSTSSNIEAVLNLLEGITDVRVLSAPELLVLNNQTARLQVGDQVPVATQSAVSVTTPGAPVVNSIEFRDTGVILKVTPRVNASGLVLLDVAQEVSDVATTTTSTLDSPTIQQRRVNSSVAVEDGATIALGGLIRDNRTRTKSGIPLLQDIPYVGNLFGVTDDSQTRTELIVLITPHVIRNAQNANEITEELREKLPLTAPLIQPQPPILQ